MNHTVHQIWCMVKLYFGIASSYGRINDSCTTKLCTENGCCFDISILVPAMGCRDGLGDHKVFLDDNLSRLSAKLEDVAEGLQHINKNRLNITLLYDEVTKVRDFDEPMLLRAFDDLVTSENNGNAFLAKKIEKYRTMRLQSVSFPAISVEDAPFFSASLRAVSSLPRALSSPAHVRPHAFSSLPQTISSPAHALSRDVSSLPRSVSSPPYALSSPAHAPSSIPHAPFAFSPY
ncbi:hypothetical protein Vadar_009752 [Vaccinium darrowii]|uniref:Uncharacterized protein n=1 Tax=Vaccinium darrowii TaxID=229202 RepID=A0ACB7XZD2_9ERIC|nr:hypothetical protein Vadar_009752 [Vaccinium darrowii]